MKERTRKHNQLCPLWPVAVLREGCPWPPISLFHRRPISTQPLTHLSHTANWAPVYSPQKRALKGKKCGGRETSGNHQVRRALDPAIPVSDPSPLLSSPHPLPQSCLYSTPPPPFLSIPLFLSSPCPAWTSFPCLFCSGPNPNRLSNCFKNILPFSAPTFQSCDHPREQTLFHRGGGRWVCRLLLQPAIFRHGSRFPWSPRPLRWTCMQRAAQDAIIPPSVGKTRLQMSSSVFFTYQRIFICGFLFKCEITIFAFLFGENAHYHREK